MFVVCRGTVEIRLPERGERVAVLGPGDYIGEMALFTGEPRTADVYALEEVEVVEIRKASIQQLFVENQTLAGAFSRKIAERQADLAKYATKPSEAQVREQTETIFHRIRQFFSLG